MFLSRWNNKLCSVSETQMCTIIQQMFSKQTGSIISIWHDCTVLTFFLQRSFSTSHWQYCFWETAVLISNWTENWDITKPKAYKTEQKWASASERNENRDGEAETERRVSIAFSSLLNNWRCQLCGVGLWAVLSATLEQLSSGWAAQHIYARTHTHGTRSMGGLMALPRQILFTHTNTPGATLLVLSE